MYYLLNYIPCIMQFVLFNLPFEVNMDIVVYAVLYFFVMPVYLLIVNCRFLLKGIFTFLKSICFMLSVVVINVAIIMVVHKIKTGYFFGDVPGSLYGIMLGIPSAIILIGSVLIFLLRSKHK